MPEKYILALDQGTTSSRAILFDKNGSICQVAQKEFTQLYPKPGWVEHDAEEIWSSQFSVLAEALAKGDITTADVAAIGITNQRETTVVWDRNTSKPVYNAIVWQDRRTASFCDKLNADGLGPSIQEKTGLVIDAYFSATKLKWILDNVSGAREKAVKGELAFGTIDTWLSWKLTNGKVHVTDVSNASRTMLMNIQTCEWDTDLLKLFDIPASVLPEIIPSSKVYGVTESVVKHANIPLAGMAGDQQAALFGQQCTQPGMVKNTYGTGCFMLMHTGTKIVRSSNNLLTTVAWKINNRVEYAVEGSIFIGGAIVQWLRDGLQMIRSSADIEEVAAKSTENSGVYIVPAFAGLGAPHWNQHARGSVFGLTRGTTKADIARAALESIAFQTMDVLKAMESDSGLPIKELRVDGGATINNMLMQFQSDLLQVPVIRPVVYETTALGAAYLAGLGVGYWESVADIQQQWKADKYFYPVHSAEDMKPCIKGWNRAVKASIAWANEPD
ncbi:glycerol kinase GlpK [Flavihumibacter fluvii]|uniref:glycerol kinase GlpK n=1 Tax=Flavihumibacter fluvii TaxID=2838157 RepID=UPI001BDE1C3E|nr:glycerol kinase GlpK [Flavihumibacter fluvii]ULQ51114.1 glycerol kinase GlpK [Flavihumibacter fluvii]